jgi:hypothetical protein
MKTKKSPKLADLSLADRQLLEKIGQEVLFKSRKKLIIKRDKDQTSNALK